MFLDSMVTVRDVLLYTSSMVESKNKQLQKAGNVLHILREQDLVHCEHLRGIWQNAAQTTCQIRMSCKKQQLARVFFACSFTKSSSQTTYMVLEICVFQFKVLTLLVQTQ